MAPSRSTRQPCTATFCAVTAAIADPVAEKVGTVLLLGAVANQHPHRWLFGAGAALASTAWFTALGAGAYRLAPLLARPAAWRGLDGLVAVLMVTIAVSLLLG